MADFEGWEMPIQYNGIIAEHKAVRERAGIFDVSHMGQIFIRGPDTVTFLSYVTTWDMRRQKDRDCRYCHILNNDGRIIDDIIAYTFTSEEYMVVPNASMIDTIFSWLLENSRGFDVHIENSSRDFFCLALQGPEAPRLLGQHLNTSVNPFRLVRGGDVIVSGTGYTGEEGCEIIGPSEEVKEHWESLVDMGAEPVGLGARDTLRLEKGYLLSGQDFDGTQTSLETGYSWVVDWDHDFIGKKNIVFQKGRTYTRLSGIMLDERGVLRPGFPVFFEGNEISHLTSGLFSV
jgi:aminomethyltransferase